MAMLVCGAGTAIAQETTSGSIAGQVMDAQGLAIPGATVTVTSAQGSKTFVSDDKGRFFAPYLTPGTYSVRVELQGFKPAEQKNVTVSLGQRVELPFTLTVGTLTESVEVKAGASPIDTSSTTVGTTIDSTLLQKIPIGRTFTDALYISPGVSSSGGAGRANPSVSGASGLENQYVVDGVNTTNSGYGAVGSYSIVFGSLGTGVPFDFLKQIQVKTGGYEAEYGQATGGVINVITKSGSNQMAGTLFGYSRPSTLEGHYTPVISTNGSRAEAVNTTGTQQSDFGGEIGGPILHDQLFYFGAIDPQWQRTTLMAPENFPLRSIGNQDQDRRIFAYAGKATWQPGAGTRVNFSAFGDPATGDNGPQRRAALLQTNTSGFSSLDYGGNNQTLNYDGVLRNNWLIEGSVSRAANSITETPSVDTWAVSDDTVTPNIQSGGIGFYEVGNNGRNLQFQAKSTNFIGDHQIRYGIEYEDIAYDNTVNYTGPTFTTPDGQQTQTGATIAILPDPNYGQIYRVTRANLSSIRNTRQDYLSVFAQDTWRWHRLTLKPGIRYEQQKLIGNVSNFTWNNNWAPRIGATYDLMGNGRTKLFGSWGRFFAKIPNDLAARALSADASITRADYFDAQLTDPIPQGVAAGPTGDTQHYITAGLSASDFDPNAKSTYEDEWVAGVQHDLFQNISVGATYMRRRFGRILEDVGTAPMVSYFLGTVPSSVEYFITNPGPNTPVTGDLGVPISFENAIHDYDAVELTAEKRFSNNWGLQASYTWSRLWGDYEGFFRNDNGQSDPSITSLDDFPTNDPTYTSIGVPRFGFSGDIRYLGALGAGPLPLDRPNQFKLYGNYMTPFGVNVGLGMQIGSGEPLTAFAANPVYENAGEIPLTPRGGGFQTEDGFKTHTPIQKDVDLHLDYNLHLGPRTVTLLADMFNLFNTQTVLDYDNYSEVVFQTPNPDFGRRLAYQTPFQLRLGARFAF
ncbi:MAG TPA: TonB-dependent receptor [Vicinamibacterales bacterium]|nr:TonB-dependent receptor [Vicinamibacterales bacterium]